MSRTLNNSLAFYIDKYNPELHDWVIQDLAKVPNGIVISNNSIDVTIDIPVFPGSSIWGFHGKVVADGFLSGRYLANCPVPTYRGVLVQQIDWSNNYFLASDHAMVYNGKMDILCTSQDIEKAINLVWHSYPTIITSILDILNIEEYINDKNAICYI